MHPLVQYISSDSFFCPLGRFSVADIPLGDRRAAYNTWRALKDRLGPMYPEWFDWFQRKQREEPRLSAYWCNLLVRGLFGRIKNDLLGMVPLDQRVPHTDAVRAAVRSYEKKGYRIEKVVEVSRRFHQRFFTVDGHDTALKVNSWVVFSGDDGHWMSTEPVTLDGQHLIAWPGPRIDEVALPLVLCHRVFVKDANGGGPAHASIDGCNDGWLHLHELGLPAREVAAIIEDEVDCGATIFTGFSDQERWR